MGFNIGIQELEPLSDNIIPVACHWEVFHLNSFILWRIMKVPNNWDVDLAYIPWSVCVSYNLVPTSNVDLLSIVFLPFLQVLQQVKG
jgi:hypothetical protein